jgi:hypothetical protein
MTAPMPPQAVWLFLRCPDHRRMRPKPGVMFTPGPRWQHCPNCRRVRRLPVSLIKTPRPKPPPV